MTTDQHEQWGNRFTLWRKNIISISENRYWIVAYNKQSIENVALFICDSAYIVLKSKTNPIHLEFDAFSWLINNMTTSLMNKFTGDVPFDASTSHEEIWLPVRECDVMWGSVTSREGVWRHVRECDVTWGSVTSREGVWRHFRKCDVAWGSVTSR